MTSFDKLDLYLIQKTRWTIRQLELFTPVSRRAVGTIFAIINLLAMAATGVILFIIMREGDFLNTLIFVAIFTFLSRTYEDLNEELREVDPIFGKKYIDGSTRKFGRRALVIVSALLLGYFTLKLLMAEAGQYSIMLQLCYICIPLVNMTAIEYFFCTTSISKNTEGS